MILITRKKKKTYRKYASYRAAHSEMAPLNKKKKKGVQ